MAQTLIKLYPTPQNSNVGQNFLYSRPAPQNWSKWDLRGDWNLGTKDNFFWRFSKQDQVVPSSLVLPPPAYGGGALDQTTNGINTGGTWNHIWKSNLIMSIRGGWNYGFFTRDNPAQTGGALLNRQYGIKGGNDSIPGGFSQMNITGYTAIGIGANNPVARDSQNRQLAGDVVWTHGSHTIKFGANMLRSAEQHFQYPQRSHRPVSVQWPIHQGRHGRFPAGHGQPGHLEHAPAGRPAQLDRSAPSSRTIGRSRRT